MTADTSVSHQEDSLFGHPKGLYICFLTELWERFSFYGMKYLLVLYLVKYHLFTDNGGYDVLGAYAGLVYATPVIGGMLADRFLGMRKAVIFGGVMLSLGHLGLAFEGEKASIVQGVIQQDTFALNTFYLSLAFIIVGVGFLKPNISTIVGKLYKRDDPRRDSGFTIFYMGINVGSWSATLICGYLGETFGWGYGFGAAGIGMLLGLLAFTWGQKFLHGHAEPKQPELLKEKVFAGISRESIIYIFSILSLALIWFLVRSNFIVHWTLNIMAIGVLIWLIWFLTVHCNKVERGQMSVLAILTIFTVVFWALFEQSAASMTLYADRVVDRVILDHVYLAGSQMGIYILGAGFLLLVILGFRWLTNSRKRFNSSEIKVTSILYALFGLVFLYLSYRLFAFGREVSQIGESGIPVRWEITAVQAGSLNAMFIILLAPVFAWLWTKLSKNKIEPHTPVKFGLGILQAGLGFGALVLGATMPNEAGKVGLIWLVLAYLLHTMGELCLSPVGLSAVTKLSVPRVVGVMMGTWFLATAYSELVAAQIAKFASVDTVEGEVADVGAALGIYTEFFTSLLLVGGGAGVLLLLLSPLLKKGMHGVH